MRLGADVLVAVFAVFGVLPCVGCGHLQDTLDYSETAAVGDPVLLGILTDPSSKPATAIVRYRQYAGDSVVPGKNYLAAFSFESPNATGDPFTYGSGPRATFDDVKANLPASQAARIRSPDAPIRWLSEAQAAEAMASPSFCKVGDGRGPPDPVASFQARDGWIDEVRPRPPGGRGAALSITAPSALWTVIPANDKNSLPPAAAILIVPAEALRPPESVARSKREAAAAVPLAILADVGTNVRTIVFMPFIAVYLLFGGSRQARAGAA